MAKPAGASIREIPAALGAFGNVLNVTSKVQGKALGRRGTETAKDRSGRNAQTWVKEKGRLYWRNISCIMEMLWGSRMKED